MSYHHTIEAQCDDCGRFETVWRGSFSSKSAARAKAKRLGWSYDQKAQHHTCPQCVKKGVFKL